MKEDYRVIALQDSEPLSPAGSGLVSRRDKVLEVDCRGSKILA